VTLWQVISTASGPNDLADQLELLLAALTARDQHYTVAASQDLTDITVPLTLDYSLFFRFLDRNVILARSDLKHSELALSNVQTKAYQATIQPIPTLPFVTINGWISVDAKIRGKAIRFFSTHLESPISRDDMIQMLQAQELILAMQQCELPVILAGDFNSDAEHTFNWTDQTPTYDWIVAAGFADVWPAKHPGEHGLTWPLFFEDFLAPYYYGLLERIDLIFVRGLAVWDVQRIGTVPPFASDHAGVVATLLIEK
jgi:endonuclease/exonuclease/phosphatase family metal-dependent hydrolase